MQVHEFQMNATQLVLAAFATLSALESGRVTDPSLIALTDDIFQANGAAACGFGACAGDVRELFFVRDVEDYILNWVPNAYDWLEYGDFFGGGRTFTRSFNSSLPAFRRVVAACLRADHYSDVLSQAGDVRVCRSGRDEYSLHLQTSSDMHRYYQTALVYNECQQRKPPYDCLLEAFQLDRTRLAAAARASQQLKDALFRLYAEQNQTIIEQHTILQQFVDADL
jgi:hypothetical protein